MNNIIKNKHFDIINPFKLKKYVWNNNIKLDNIKEVYENSKTYEIFKKPKQNKIKRKITAPPYSFQIDITVFKPFKNKKFCFSLIDIESRKAFMYILKNKWLDEINHYFKIFINDMNEQKIKINSITGDLEFNKKAFVNICNDNNIKTYFIKSADEHIINKGSNVLGIIDRFTRTIKHYLNKYLNKINWNDWPNALDTILNVYNDLPHRGLYNYKYWPNDVFKNSKLLLDKFNENLFNENKNKPKYNIGDVVRKIKNNNIFDKEKANFSDELYIIVNIVKNRYSIENLKTNEADNKLYKYNELLLTKNSGLDDNKESQKINNFEKKIKIKNKLKKESVDKKNIISDDIRTRKEKKDFINDTDIKKRLRSNK